MYVVAAACTVYIITMETICRPRAPIVGCGFHGNVIYKIEYIPFHGCMY